MSKVIETLKSNPKESLKTDASPEIEKTKSSYELTQEQLAEIYFSSSNKPKKSEDSPLIIKVIEKQKTLAIGPWIIAGLALLLAVFSLFSTKRIFFDIKIVDELGTQLNGAPSPKTTVSDEEITGFAQKKNPLRYGDHVAMQDFEFEGAAKLNSSKNKSQLTVVNSSVAPFARAQLYFEPPLNLSGSKLVFYAKGNRNGTNLAIALKDNENVAAFEKGKIYPFHNTLTTDWQRAEIPVFATIGTFDTRNVISLRFEIGSKDTENKPGDTIFIKDLQIVPV